MENYNGRPFVTTIQLALRSWRPFPAQSLILTHLHLIFLSSLGLQILYTTQTAYYIAASIVVLFLTNVRANHKDRFIMLMHHAVTITLLAVSFALGQHRIGSVVLILHDVSDVFLEGAKLCRYSGLDLMTNSVFATFALVFFISRLVIFPTRVLWATFQAYEHNVVYAVSACFAKDGMCEGTPLFVFPLKWFWLTLLGTLQCLHVYWFALIFRMVIRAVAARHIEKDIRSDDEEQLSDDDADHATNNMKNGHKKKND